MSHYTSVNDEAFINRVTFDFIAQLEHKLETSGTTQCDFARRMNVTEGAVSQVLNLNRTNLNLRTMVRYARALGMKVAVVAYDDRDPQNENGPVGSEIFSLAWEKIGRPRDVWSVNENIAANYATSRCLFTLSDWTLGWANSTLSSLPNTAEDFRVHISPKMTEKASTAHA
jgi:transcriptional regulator with XRE-family HTH domain